jgi:hypothetical protein
LRSGYGLPVRATDSPTKPVLPGFPPIACGEDLCSIAEGQATAARRNPEDDARLQ